MDFPDIGVSYILEVDMILEVLDIRPTISVIWYYSFYTVNYHEHLIYYTVAQ